MPDERQEHGRSAFDMVMGMCEVLNGTGEVIAETERRGITLTEQATEKNKPAEPPPPPRFPETMPTKVGIPLGDLKQLIRASESGDFGGYDALAWHPNYVANAMSRPRDQLGFPAWEGSSSTGKGSHGAGAYQLEPGLWQEFAPKLGITDFSPESQDRVAEAAIMRYGTMPWKTNTKLQAAIKAYKAAGNKLPANLPYVNAETKFAGLW